MTRPVRVIRWDNIGAPQRSPADAASIVEILKKCLVEGFGDTEPLGWTLEYEDAPNAVAVFRNSPVNGSGGYARIRPYNVPTNAYIITQSAMSATGTSSADLFNPGYINSIPTEAILTRWVLIGDDVSFYFMLHHASQDFGLAAPGLCMFFGDITTAVPTDVSKFICTGVNNGSTSSVLGVNGSPIFFGPLSYSGQRNSVLNSSLSGDNQRGRIGFPASVSGISGYVNYSLYIAGETTESQPNGTITNTTFPAGATLQPVAVKREDALTAATMFDADIPYIRGYMPGLMSPIFRTHYSAVWPVVQEIGGKNYFGIPIASSSANYGGIRVWINTEDWG